MVPLSRADSTTRPAHPRAVFQACVAVAALLLGFAPPTHAAGGWQRPVAGAVVRPFDYAPTRAFAAGAHRGVDLDAAVGSPVRAACAGRVIHAGGVAALGGVVTVRCGDRRVTYMPLAAIAVHEGAPVVRGARLGTVAAGHGGLHVGVRRAGDAFGYEDPLAYFGGGTRPLVPVVPWPRTPARPTTIPAQPPAPGPTAAPSRASATRPPPVPTRPPTAHPPAAPAHPLGGGVRPGASVRAPLASPAVPRPRPASARRGIAPWPVWIGLAGLLTGCIGTGTAALGRRRRAAPAPVSAGLS